MTPLLYIILAAWLAAALLAGALGVVASLQPPLPQLILFALVAFLIIAYSTLRPFRNAISSLPLDALVAIHFSRFVGLYFLLLYAADRLPFAFAVPGGIGDIVIAVAAVILVALRIGARAASPLIYATWNALGLIDILFVALTAARLAVADPESMAELFRLPLCLLPTFLVPLIIFSHIVIGHRLIARQPSPKCAA